MWGKLKVICVVGGSIAATSNAFINSGSSSSSGSCVTCHHRQQLRYNDVSWSSPRSASTTIASLAYKTDRAALALLVTRRGHNSVRRSTSLSMQLSKKPSKYDEPGKEEPLMNQQITCAEVRVVLNRPEGDEQIGILPIQQALERAEQLECDLVMISPTADPPVCKIIDYGKFRYLSEKKKKDNRKNAKANEVKEVKMSYKIEEHDYQVRLRNAQKFISAGNRVKFLVQFRGREQQHMELGNTLLKKVIVDCEGLGVAEDPVPKRQGNTLILYMSPKKTA